MTTETFTFASLDDLKKLAETRTEKDRYSSYHRTYRKYHPIELDQNPIHAKEALGKRLGFPDHLNVRACVISDMEWNNYYEYNYNSGYRNVGYTLKKGMAEKLHKLPLFVLINPDNYNNKKGFRPSDDLLKLAETGKNPYYFGEVTGGHYYGYGNQDIGNANIAVQVTHEGHEFYLLMPFIVAERAFGLEVTNDLNIKLSSGAEGDFGKHKDILNNLNAYRRGSYRDAIDKFDFTFTTVAAVESKIGMNRKNLGKILAGLVKTGWKIEEPGKLSGIKKTWVRLEPVMKEVMEEDPVVFCSYRSFAEACARSVDGVKISAVFNDVFDKVNTKEEFIKALKDFYLGTDEDGNTLYDAKDKLEAGVKRLDVYKSKRKEVLKSQANRAFAKIQQEADNLTIDKKKHKLTWAEIEAGNLPLGTFFRKSEQYFLLNDNWDLWEEMFKRGFRDQAIELANEVKGRTTYEKDLMSYFYFVLHGLPEFLKRHTGHKWTCSPKLVNSAEELEPPKEDSGGVARKRSALTPLVDNENHTVVVPYASLAIYGGFGTTYCYSHDYHVLTKGFSFNGYAITSEIEKDLNGRDDYGLMFYTLTGSAQGRGYPTFLIIFERREGKGDTRVHFHRTHPFRSKDGDYNPIHNWIKGCYNWMAGNIKRDRIKAQQGDLFFVQVKTDAKDEELDGAVVKNLDFSHKVNQYDNHKFEEAVPFAEYTKAAKANILGYVQLEKDTWLRHNEHDDVLIPQGTYAIHQCRSWEANPKGIWSLRID